MQLEAAELNGMAGQLWELWELWNLLYSAVAAQGGSSVEATMSPYLAMTVPAPDRHHHRVRHLQSTKRHPEPPAV